MKQNRRKPKSDQIRRSKSRGYSLAETVVSLVILSVAILAITIVPLMSSKMMLQTTQREQAMFLALKGLDYLESVGLDAAVSDDVQDGVYTVELRKPLYDALSAADYKATVTVRWRGMGGQSELVSERMLSRLSHETCHNPAKE